MAKADLTVARLRELLHHDPETGIVTWKARTSPLARIRVGDRAGRVITKQDGRRYRHIKIYGRELKEHRVIWALHYGEWPTANIQIDHRNGNGLDNRIANLRLASRSANMQNQRRAQSDNTTGFLGVSPSREKFRARINLGGRVLCLGTFDTPELAHAAYLAVKRAHHAGNML